MGIEPLNKEKFLQDHIDALQKDIWLLEIDKAIIISMIPKIKDKQQLDNAIQSQNIVSIKIKGLNERKGFIMKVINGTIKLEN